MRILGRAVAFAVVIIFVRTVMRSHREQFGPGTPNPQVLSNARYPGYSEGGSTDVDEDDGESLEEGAHEATVDYYNPSTGWSNTYDLDVEVEDGRVTEIRFPNGGYITADEELDDEGNATVYDDEGREYEVHVDQ
jgi:hypothetical protein